ncbi:MAG: hypothetical protein J6328_05015 [Bacilli bacterium]|nr:hypothetical protein [Bacilli bacterium]
MREFDQNGLDIASFQAELFEESLSRSATSSPIFLRRFFLSRWASSMDRIPVPIQSFDLNEAFASIEEQFGKSEYGKLKYDPDALYWLGYITRYIAYTREISSKLLYRLFDVKRIYSLYEAYHTQSEERCIAHLLSLFGYDEKVFDVNERIKGILRKQYQNLFLGN